MSHGLPKSFATEPRSHIDLLSSKKIFSAAQFHPGILHFILFQFLDFIKYDIYQIRHIPLITFFLL